MLMLMPVCSSNVSLIYLNRLNDDHDNSDNDAEAHTDRYMENGGDACMWYIFVFQHMPARILSDLTKWIIICLTVWMWIVCRLWHVVVTCDAMPSCKSDYFIIFLFAPNASGHNVQCALRASENCSATKSAGRTFNLNIFFVCSFVRKVFNKSALLSITSIITAIKRRICVNCQSVFQFPLCVWVPGYIAPVPFCTVCAPCQFSAKLQFGTTFAKGNESDSLCRFVGWSDVDKTYIPYAGYEFIYSPLWSIYRMESLSASARVFGEHFRIFEFVNNWSLMFWQQTILIIL